MKYLFAVQILVHGIWDGDGMCCWLRDPELSDLEITLVWQYVSYMYVSIAVITSKTTYYYIHEFSIDYRYLRIYT